MLTNASPIQGKDSPEVLQKARRGQWRPPRQINAAIPAALNAICCKAMALAPDRRYQSPQSLIKDLENWLPDEPASAYREPLTLRMRRWMRRHPSLVSATTASLVLGLLATAGLAFLSGQHTRELAAKNSTISN